MSFYPVYPLLTELNHKPNINANLVLLIILYNLDNHCFTNMQGWGKIHKKYAYQYFLNTLKQLPVT